MPNRLLKKIEYEGNMKSIVEKLDEKIKSLKEKFGNNFFSKKTDSNVKMCEIFNAKNGNLNKLRKL